MEIIFLFYLTWHVLTVLLTIYAIICLTKVLGHSISAFCLLFFVDTILIAIKKKLKDKQILV